MAALHPRHRWMVSQVVAAFNLEDEETAVEFAFRGHFFSKIEKLLSGFSRRQYIIFVYQEPKDGKSAASDSSLDAKLICTDGTESGLHARAIYFLKTTPRGKPVNVNVASDAEVLFGEIASTPLSSLSVMLSDVFLPVVERFTEQEWKSCRSEQRREFVGGFRSFCKDLSGAVHSLSCGIDLRKPDSAKVSDDARRDPALAAKNPETVLHFEGLLEDWCRQIERYLETSLEQSNEPPDAGPRSEIEYWRNRMQRLNSITEQLKSDSCKFVFETLYAVSKTNAEVTPKSRQTAFHALRRCRQIDLVITEAFNEAKDNVKYLSTLENFIDPLYTGTPQHIIDNLAALMNAVTMIHSISRYYNTNERMTSFFIKITNQMIANCKKGVLEGDHYDKLWDREPEELIRKLEACSRLNEAYHEHYRITKDKLLTTPKGKQFDFSEQQIFGRMDLFCRRVLKLITLFSIIRQFQSISRHRFEGLEVFVDRFKQILAEFRSKRHDMLDFTNNRFDRDFVEFTVRVADLETALQPFINQSFESTTSIDASLQLLKKFQSVVHSENLKSELKNKITIIFHRYGWELQQIQEQYERLRTNPPLDRDMPPIAGSIVWARHLLKRIEGPMKKFEEHPFVLSSREAKKTVRLYNKVAATLLEFELLWYQTWKDSIPAARAHLQATLLARHETTGKLFVNFSPQIVQLIRETKALDRLRLNLPEDAKLVLLREKKLKNYFQDFTHVLEEYRRISSMIRPITAALLQPHLNSVEKLLKPGETTLTWISMNIESYLQSLYAGLAKLEQLVVTVNDIVENRIDGNLQALSRVMIVQLPAPGATISLQSFVDMQDAHVKQTAAHLNGRSVEIESAVYDLVRASLACPLEKDVEPVHQEDILKIKKQYQWNFYSSLLKATKTSLFCLKTRLQARPRKSGAS
ncbi:putative dynein gamma chain, flagellar outer arm [Besnoitia besnoiti]|uniref:Putative dynein gamma chain, flagellar outer arm n=1 Tax=Besnoitia besnoiti TaxID=94643 RepID=A0A2A9M5N7_BESBE|nr:putative dynein gamma chain, flagellar outer arm [Besnoitia besnoiti]PFH32514.1 putative dynein gamma chain, flagellar outer arm [Besnoitia besnoiti]